MLEQITFIRDKVELDGSSLAACYFRMIASVFLIPFCGRLLLCVLEAIGMPITVGTWQFFIYGIMIAAYWYICRIRMWSHSYMIGYIHTALNNSGDYCPRCFSRMKDENRIYTYEEKTGEYTYTVHNYKGMPETHVKNIYTERSEELPVYQCANWDCYLQTRARASSAQSLEVRNQVKEYYSFYEMPRTFKNTFRLIAGDFDDGYTKSITAHFHGKAHHTVFIVLCIIITIFSAMANFDTLTYVTLRLLEPTENLTAYGFMVAILLVGYFYIQAYLKKKCNEISTSQEYIEKCKKLDEDCHGVYLAKKLTYTAIKRRRQAIRKARKANDPVVANLKEYDYRGEYRLARDKLNYTYDSLNAIYDFIPDMGFTYDVSYVNGCYMVEATTEDHPGKIYKIFINSENGCTVFSLDVLCGFPHAFRNHVLKNWKKENKEHLNGCHIYVCEDKVVLSFTVLCAKTYEFTDDEKENLRLSFEQFYELMKTFVSENAPQ